jgi:hypothetical protein
MSKLDLDAIEARCEAASPGPWTAKLGRTTDWIADGRCGGISDANGEEIITTDSGVYGPEEADAAFIAAARTDVPALLAEVRRLRAVVDAFATAAEDEVTRFEVRGRGPGGQQAGSGFSEWGNVGPAAVSQLRWWAREMRAAIDEHDKATP